MPIFAVLVLIFLLRKHYYFMLRELTSQKDMKSDMSSENRSLDEVH